MLFWHILWSYCFTVSIVDSFSYFSHLNIHFICPPIYALIRFLFSVSFHIRDLHHNQITSIASGSFSRLSNLQYLWVDWCVSSIEFKYSAYHFVDISRYGVSLLVVCWALLRLTHLCICFYQALVFQPNHVNYKRFICRIIFASCIVRTYHCFYLSVLFFSLQVNWYSWDISLEFLSIYIYIYLISCCASFTWTLYYINDIDFYYCIIQRFMFPFPDWYKTFKSRTSSLFHCPLSHSFNIGPCITICLLSDALQKVHWLAYLWLLKYTTTIPSQALWHQQMPLYVICAVLSLAQLTIVLQKISFEFQSILQWARKFCKYMHTHITFIIVTMWMENACT